jgi:hypothetical protein
MSSRRRVVARANEYIADKSRIPRRKEERAWFRSPHNTRSESSRPTCGAWQRTVAFEGDDMNRGVVNLGRDVLQCRGNCGATSSDWPTSRDPRRAFAG